MGSLRSVGLISALAFGSIMVGFAAGEPPAPRLGVDEPLAKAPGTIRVVTYNVENLFDDVDDPSLSGRNEDIDDTKPGAELAALAETIRRLDADVIALQEIESREALDCS